MAKKIIIGTVSFIPLVGMIVFFSFVLGSFSKPELLESYLIGIIGAHLVMILVSICLLIFFALHIFRESGLSQNEKVMWMVILFFGGFIAFPIYWYLYIWKVQKIEK